MFAFGLQMGDDTSQNLQMYASSPINLLQVREWTEYLQHRQISSVSSARKEHLSPRTHSTRSAAAAPRALLVGVRSDIYRCANMVVYGLVVAQKCDEVRRIY